MSRSAVTQLAQSAKQACQPLSMLSSAEKNRALKMMAEAVRKASSSILKANLADLAAARKEGFQPAMTARLALDEKKIQKIADSIVSIAELPDPVGRKLWERKRPNGLVIQKISVPIGSILIVYESRPNVTADCMALCLKSGNAVILKGGKEAHRTNHAIFSAMSRAARNAGIPKSFAHLVEGNGRAVVKELLQLSHWIDLVIPRGGEGLIREVARTSRIPVIKHYKGVCHVYVDASADLEKAERIVLNAKTQNPAVCNAMECLLVHEKIAPRFLPALGRSLQEKGVEIHADRLAARWLAGSKAATTADWGKEYLELKMAAKVVKDVHEAIEHIRRYGSGHSDAIVTENEACAALFKAAVDSSAVFVNCSTRFNDGGEFGMGAEMGISTDKLHARGPMGLEELTSYKYIVSGDGQIRG